MVFGLGGGGQKAAAEHARKEVIFWKSELDHAVDEKNAWRDRFFAVYNRADALNQHIQRLEHEKAHLAWERDRLAAGTVATTAQLKRGSGEAAATASGGRAAVIPVLSGPAGSGPSCASSCPSSQGSPTPQDRLHAARQALRQADVRIAILEERVFGLQRELDVAGREAELARASEAAVQQEVAALREELTKSDRINSVTADETTHLLLENSRLAQANAALQVEVMHKEEVNRLLNQQISELSAALDAIDPDGTAAAGACAGGAHSANSSFLASLGLVAPTLGGAATSGAGPSYCTASSGAALDPSGVVATSGAGGSVTGGGAAAAAAGALADSACTDEAAAAAAGGVSPGPRVPRLPIMDLGPLPLPGVDRIGAFTGETITPRDMREFEQQQGAASGATSHRRRPQICSHQLQPTPRPAAAAADEAVMMTNAAARGPTPVPLPTATPSVPASPGGSYASASPSPVAPDCTTNGGADTGERAASSSPAPSAAAAARGTPAAQSRAATATPVGDFLAVAARVGVAPADVDAAGGGASTEPSPRDAQLSARSARGGGAASPVADLSPEVPQRQAALARLAEERARARGAKARGGAGGAAAAAAPRGGRQHKAALAALAAQEAQRMQQAGMAVPAPAPAAAQSNGSPAVSSGVAPAASEADSSAGSRAAAGSISAGAALDIDAPAPGCAGCTGVGARAARAAGSTGSLRSGSRRGGSRGAADDSCGSGAVTAADDTVSDTAATADAGSTKGGRGASGAKRGSARVASVLKAFQKS